jgi:hypothetical protein
MEIAINRPAMSALACYRQPKICAGKSEDIAGISLLNGIISSSAMPVRFMDQRVSANVSHKPKA